LDVLIGFNVTIILNEACESYLVGFEIKQEESVGCVIARYSVKFETQFITDSLFYSEWQVCENLNYIGKKF
jgi:hypothetical protein